MLDLFLAFLLPIPEYATSQDYSAYTQVPAKAPISIDACEGSQDKERGVVAHSTLEYGAAFTILGPKPAKRVRLRFSFDDKTWKPVATSEVEVTGDFAPGKKISRTHRYGGGFKESRTVRDAVAVICVPEEIEFADGSLWDAPAYVPQTMNTPVPQPVQSAPSSPRQIRNNARWSRRHSISTRPVLWWLRYTAPW